jgi:uncharacterized protein
MNLKRFHDIIAVKTGPTGSGTDAAGGSAAAGTGESMITAFHARNLEIAEMSEEAFNEMINIQIRSSVIPTSAESSQNPEALQSLKDWNSEENPDVKSGRISFGIKSLTLNVTQICNLKCTYCAAGGDGTYGEAINRINVEKTLPQLKFFLENLKPGSHFNLSFVGGEPFLYPEAMKAIYDYITLQTAGRDIACKFMVTTNGTLMTDKAIELLKTMKIHVSVSLDGVAEINDHVRPSKDGKSSTAATLNGIKKLVEIREHLASISIVAVASSENMRVKESYLFFRSLNVDAYEFNFSYSEKSQAAQDEYLKQMAEIAQLAWEFGGEDELRKIKTFNAYFDVFDNQQRIENFCGAGKSYLMIDAKNRLYTCPWVVGEKDEVVGEGSQLDYDKLDKYQKPLIELNNCNNCWARFVCGGGCMYIHREHTGDKHKKDELFCERTRSLIILGILYYKRARAS